MSNLYVTVTNDSIGQAIADLEKKCADLTTGTSLAERHFERLIGGDDHPDITIDEKIRKLTNVRTELSHMLEALERDEAPSTPGLSGEAILVLTDYSDNDARQGLPVAHRLIGQGMPSAQLTWAANVARGKLALIMDAILNESDPPEVTFTSYFEAYIEEIGEEAFDEEDDDFFIGASIQYLTALIDDPELAWSNGIEIPEVLFDHVLSPYLELAKGAVRLH